MFATAPESRFPPIGNTFLNWFPASPRIERRSRSYSGFASYPRSADAPNWCEEDGKHLKVCPLPVGTRESYATARKPQHQRNAARDSGPPKTLSLISLSLKENSPRSVDSTRCSSAGLKGSSSEASLSDPVTPPAHDQIGTLALASDELVTTLMIRNLPSSIQQKDVMGKLDALGFRNLYDFVYVPGTFGKNRNKGYAFLNLLTAEAASSLMKSWQKTRIFGPCSQSLDISPGHIQGFEANVAAWGSAKKERIKNERYRPWFRKMSIDETISSIPVLSESGGSQGSAAPQKPHSKFRSSARKFQQEQEESSCALATHEVDGCKILATVPTSAFGAISNQ